MQFFAGVNFINMLLYEVNDGTVGHTTVLTLSFHRIQSTQWIVCTMHIRIQAPQNCIRSCILVYSWKIARFFVKVESNELNIFIKNKFELCFFLFFSANDDDWM